MHEPPPLPAIDKEQAWGNNMRLWIQVDNQQVAQLFSDLSRLASSFFEPLCIRVSRKLLQLIESGWRPRTDVAPFIEWDRREHNGLADHAANVDLDIDADWESTAPGAFRILLKDPSIRLRLCSDGARRGSGKAAAGFALISYSRDRSSKVLRRPGRVLGCLDSAFTSEMMALEWCLDSFLDMLR